MFIHGDEFNIQLNICFNSMKIYETFFNYNKLIHKFIFETIKTNMKKKSICIKFLNSTALVNIQSKKKQTVGW